MGQAGTWLYQTDGLKKRWSEADVVRGEDSVPGCEHPVLRQPNPCFYADPPECQTEELTKGFVGHQGWPS